VDVQNRFFDLCVLDKRGGNGYNKNRGAPMTVASPLKLRNNRCSWKLEAVISFYYYVRRRLPD
jgi:hypothetical protein